MFSVCAYGKFPLRIIVRALQRSTQSSEQFGRGSSGVSKPKSKDIVISWRNVERPLPTLSGSRPVREADIGVATRLACRASAVAHVLRQSGSTLRIRTNHGKLKRADYHRLPATKDSASSLAASVMITPQPCAPDPMLWGNSARGRRSRNDHHGIATGFAALTLGPGIPCGPGCAGIPCGSGCAGIASGSGRAGLSGRSCGACRACGPGNCWARNGNWNHRRRSYNSGSIARA